MNIGDPSRTAAEVGSTGTKTTHLENLLNASQLNEKRLLGLAIFACEILTKIRGNSVPQNGNPRPEKAGGTLGDLEESICNSGDSIGILETALAELNGTV